MQSFFREAAFTLVIQINGKVRGQLLLPTSTADEDLKRLALEHVKADERLQKWVPGEPKKVILARRKLVNIVT